MIRVGNMGEKTSVFRRATRTQDALCPVHGRYTAKLVPLPGRELWTSCPACEDEKRAKKLALELEQSIFGARQRRVEDALDQAAIPPRFLNRTLATFRTDSPEQAQVLKACREYVGNWPAVQQQGTCILLLGKPGTGKTHLAVGIAHAVLAIGHTAVYTRVSGLCQAVRSTYADRSLTEREVYQRYTAPDLLVIDELGRQYGSEAERMMLFEVINARYEACRPMVVVSNLEPGAFAEFLGQACFSRLMEGNGRAVCFGGPNLRLGGAQA